MVKKKPTMLDYFPDHMYRYLNKTGDTRAGAIVSHTKRDDLNVAGYDAYFTVNGFKDAPDCTKEHCTSINAFFVDIDGRKDMEELEMIKRKLDPSFITETKNGFHIYWLLDEPIYKEECKDWDEQIMKWEKIEQAIVTELKADNAVKDIPRILRIPETYYWKNTGEKWKEGLEGVVKIKGLYKEPSHTYSMDQVAEAFPIQELVDYTSNTTTEKMQKYADDERKAFFNKVNEIYPIEERPSFNRLISGKKGTLPKEEGQRNQALLVAGTLMRQAGWKIEKAIEHITETGWHGIEKENSGINEIISTLRSAYQGNYTYSFKNEIVAHNMTGEEQIKIQEAYTGVAKLRKETDKVRFYNYEREILARHPYLKKNEVGIVYDYKGGVYKMLTDQEVDGLIFTGLYDDMLWNYRTGRNVSDKVKCLLSIIPDFKLTDDKGYFMNVKNGILNIRTRVLQPHTPNFVSLIQSPVEYDKDAKCPVWDSAMDAWMDGTEKEDKTLLLQQFAGYCLSSSMNYDRALFLVGDGGNGKSTFVDTIAMIIGEDATSHIDLEDLYKQFGLKGLIGKRLNIIEEVSGNYYQSHKLKKLISGEKTTADMKYKDQFTFRPQAKFVFAVNQMPRVDDTSTATERRICAVTFKNNFRDNPNTQLRSSVGLLAKELPGILNWMLDGADSLVEMGNFVRTKEQTLMLAEYRQENSSVEGFIEECIEFEEGATMPARELYDEYKVYCQKDGRKFKGNLMFVKEIKAFGARDGRLKFIERASGHDVSKFEGVKISEGWKGVSASAQYNGWN